ncbi:type III PLP-dependent enzyme [Nitrosomonas eutropha]|uniref:type III PLP-dependent enzyme n=1 Tax=Nitrosomonas eutropha TaxID=916 RepID=UPI0008C00270|nr:type III PLP-dependent enzyme [Nitrosomonas eutropha]SEJ27017.1 ornithine decarboxylase [Nitrosomonas eutropha]
MKKLSAAVQQQTENVIFDTHPEISIDLSLVDTKLKQGYLKPFLMVDTAIIRNKARRFKAAMPRVHPHYAAKANPDPRVLKTLIEEGVGFEIASIAELDLLMGFGVPAAEIFYSNPMKSRAYLQYAAAKGVEWYVLDSVEELRKIVSIKADAKLYLRIDTPNIGSDWPLAGKFGTHLGDVREIIDEAVKLNADLAGVTFHVGSQCRNPQNWRVGIERAKTVFASMREAGLNPRLLNLGGGYPVRYVKPIPSIEIIAEVINEAIADLPQNIRIMAEPGRYLVSDSACFVCRVVGTATRNGKRWMYWDAGIFGGIIEVSEGLRYEILTQRNGSLAPWSVAGPTCDSVDVLMHDEMLPEDVREDDFIFIPNAGAYTTSYASNFNGFPLPDVIVV